MPEPRLSHRLSYLLTVPLKPVSGLLCLVLSTSVAGFENDDPWGEWAAPLDHQEQESLQVLDNSDLSDYDRVLEQSLPESPSLLMQLEQLERQQLGEAIEFAESEGVVGIADEPTTGEPQPYSNEAATEAMPEPELAPYLATESGDSDYFIDEVEVTDLSLPGDPETGAQDEAFEILHQGGMEDSLDRFAAEAAALEYSESQLEGDFEDPETVFIVEPDGVFEERIDGFNLDGADLQELIDANDPEALELLQQLDAEFMNEEGFE